MRYFKIFLVILVIISLYLIIAKFIEKKVSDKLTIDRLEKSYCYFELEDTVVNAFAVTNEKDVDMMLNYYDFKRKNTVRFEYNNIRPLRRIPVNQEIFIQRYLRDSNIIFVGYKQYNKYRNDSIPVKVFVPSYVIHERPLHEIE